MELTNLKNVISPVLNQLCREIQINDAVIEWVDIIFEQIGTASKCPPHSHTWFEFNYVLSGQMETHFTGDSIIVREDQFFLIPPGMVHSHSYTRGNPHEGICFRWRIRCADPELGVRPDSLYERLNRLHAWKPGAYRDEEVFSDMLASFFEDAARNYPELGLQLLLVRLLERLSLLQQSSEGHTENSRSTAEDPLVRKVEVYLEDFQGSRLNVTDLAASLHMSYGHLSRQYKKLTGNTIVERMNQIRLGKAAELLHTPGLMVSEVAEQSGFIDICYFSKAFKKRYGQSPQNYRKHYIEA